MGCARGEEAAGNLGEHEAMTDSEHVDQAENGQSQQGESAHVDQAESDQTQQGESAHVDQAETAQSQQGESAHVDQADIGQSQQGESAHVDQAESRQSQQGESTHVDQGKSAQSEQGESAMGTIATVAQTFEVNLGVGPGVAQALAWVSVLLISYLVIQMAQTFFMGGKKRKARGQKLLIIGQTGAGKTALFFRLRDCVPVDTVSSLKPLSDIIKIKPQAEGSDSGAAGGDDGADDDAFGPVEVVDFPGHNRLRGKLAEQIGEARCIVYVVDSEGKQKLKDAAEHLYELLTHPDVCELHTPILLALNKIDLPGARTEKFVMEELDREIEQMRVSRSACLEGQDQADSYLGIDGEKFKLLEHSPVPIEACRVSVKKPQLQPVYDFLRQHFA